MVRSLRMIVRLLTVGILTGMMIVCDIVFFDKLHSIVSGADAGKMIVCAAEKDAYDTLRIVIDPGHGGENLGGEYEDYTEKEMTIVVAEAMKEELEKYEGVSVYLTRNGDQELSLEERCEYAKSVDADFLFCLHFNLSEHHTLFGAECWVSAFGENYSKGYAFASVEMELLQELGLYSRAALRWSCCRNWGYIPEGSRQDLAVRDSIIMGSSVMPRSGIFPVY